MVKNKIDWVGKFSALFLMVVFLGSFAYVGYLCYGIFTNHNVNFILKFIIGVFFIGGLIGSGMIVSLVYSALWKRGNQPKEETLKQDHA